MSDEPAEAMRQAVALLTTNVAVLTEATNSLKTTIKELQADVVRKGEYEQRVKHIEDDVEDLQDHHRDAARSQASFRRSVYLTLLGFALPLLGTLLLAGIGLKVALQ